MLKKLKEEAQKKLTSRITEALLGPLDRLLGTSVTSVCNVVTATAETAEAKISSGSSRLIQLLESKKSPTAPHQPSDTFNQESGEEQLVLPFPSSPKEGGSCGKNSSEQASFTWSAS